MKKRKYIAVIAVVLSVAVICGTIWNFNAKNKDPNEKLNYEIVIVKEETNPYYQTGFADYVFIGRVNQEIERTFSSNGSARTIYGIMELR